MISINTMATLAALILIGTIILAFIGTLTWSQAGITILCLFVVSGLNSYIAGLRYKRESENRK